MPEPFTKNTVYDGFDRLDAGVNTGLDHELLPKNQLASGVNLTVRGGFATNRPPFNNFTLDFGGDPILQSRFQNGRFQGAEYYKPDSGNECIIAAIGGRLFLLKIGSNSAKVSEITITGNTTTTAPFTVPAVGAQVSVLVFSTVNIIVNTEILIGSKDYTVVSVDSNTNTVVVTNLDDTPGDVIPIGTPVQFYDPNPDNRTQVWMWQAEKWMIINDGQSVPIFYDGASSRRSDVDGAIPELPAARMGCYGMGRVWQSGTDGRTFLAGNIVGGEGGTAANNGRDAVLKVTENDYLAGGGRFQVPGSVGEITAMIFTAQLDASLGQGPLAVLTPEIIFSCNTPVDRTTWQSLTNPILTESQISDGGLGAWSTIMVNGDVIYRSPTGIRSLVQGRREFFSYGNVPISREVNLYIDPDEESLLGYGSAIYFDNRTLMTFSPAFTQHGIFHRGIIAFDGDIISGMRGKEPPVYDGAWTGLSVLKLVEGTFNKTVRAFAFDLNGDTQIDLYELLPTPTQADDNFDNGTNPITWQMESPQMFLDSKQKSKQDPCRLMNGEIYVNDLVGKCHFQVFYRPDDYPCWTLWHEWDECAGENTCTPDPVTGCLPVGSFQPQYRQRMGLGEPSPKDCDDTTDRPLREGYSFQVRIVIQGHCKFRWGRFMVEKIDQNIFAPMVCTEEGECDTPLISMP